MRRSRIMTFRDTFTNFPYGSVYGNLEMHAMIWAETLGRQSAEL